MAEPEGAQIEPGSLRRLVQASRTWDAVSRREMRAKLREAVQPAVEATKAEVLGALPPRTSAGQSASSGGLRSGRHGGGGGGLRAGLAAGVSVSIRSGRESGGTVKGEGVRVITSGKKLPAAEGAMVKAYMAATFRHPVFGDKSTYVEQHGKNWFYKPLRAGTPKYRAAIVAAINEASEAIAKD